MSMDDDGKHQFKYNNSITEAVIEAVSFVTGKDSEALSPLHEAVDPDALEALFENRDTTGAVVFEYEDLEITVSNTGEIIIEQQNTA